MYHIVKDENRKGFGYVLDYVGNVWFYGTMKSCKEFKEAIERSIADEAII